MMDDGAQNTLVFQVKDKYFEDEYNRTSKAIRVWSLKGISKHSLYLSGAVGNLKMSKPIKPTSVIFNKESGYLFQKKPDIIACGLIVNIYTVYKFSSKTISSTNALKTVYLVQLK